MTPAQPITSARQNLSTMSVVAIGDSLTNEQPDNWLALVAAQLPSIRVTSEAHDGWGTNAFFLERLADVAFAKVPTDAGLFIILIGSNNLFEAGGGSDLAVTAACDGVVRIVEHAIRISPGADVLLVAPPNVSLRHHVEVEPKPARRIDTYTPEFLQKLSAAYRETASQHSWRFADLYPVLSDDDFADAAHPNAIGNVKIANVIGPKIAAWLTEHKGGTRSPHSCARA